jgi:two-component system, NtrC family, response regulator HydG
MPLHPSAGDVRTTPGPQPLLLVVDDEQPVLNLIQKVAQNAGYHVTTCSNGNDALRQLARKPADLAMVDLRMPDVNGLDLLRDIRRAVPGCEVILMTGHAGVDSAVEAIKRGAREYLTKPFDFARLGKALADVRTELARRAQIAALEGAVARELEFCGMFGRSPAMQEVFSLIQRLAPHAKAVLLNGETGTGKELAARAFHQTGPRRDRPFVTVNCSAVAERTFDAAEGGTLFLDEVGELPPPEQAELLRTLEFDVDASIVAATSRDLRADVANGRFRGDLFFRLNAVELTLPPLRERREDIPYLTAAFMNECAARMRKPLTAVTPAAESLLLKAPWDGNVRELRNIVERACMLAEGNVLSEREIEAALGPSARSATKPADAMQVAAPSSALQDVERGHIVDVLRRVNGNRMAAAKILGISRRALYRRLDRHHIKDRS